MNTVFENYLKSTLERYLEGTPQHLRDSIQYSLLSPGKRIRPRLMWECAKMVGLQDAEILPAAVAIEMVHCFTLIHDDLPCMDDDDFRRGLPSNHKKFGESTALLAGDGLLALAAEVLLDTGTSAGISAALKRLLWAAGPRGVIGGQAAESALGERSSLEDLYAMHRKKTGALFSASLLIPKDLAGIANQTEKGRSLEAFADELGLAFQIADDLEDGGETPDLPHAPTSVLYYLSHDAASQQAIQRITRASTELERVFGENSVGLCRIADEVIKKIDATLDH